MDIYYLICDLGGGTSDMSVHKVSKNGNNKITQITPDDGIQCGSHLLDKNFIDLARVKCFGQDVSPSPVELARMGHKFATETKINYDGSKKIEFKHDFVVQSKTVTIHVTNEELKEKVFNPVFNEIIDTIKRVIEEADIKPDLIYFSGGLSLAKAFQKEAKHSSFASKLFFKDDGGDWDVVTGAAMFAMDPEIITERAIKRPSFLEAYFCYSNKSDSSVNSKTINGTKYSKNRILDLYDSSSVENNEFFEHQLSLLTEGNDTITLALYNGLPKSEFSELEARLTDDTRISHSHTYHISLADLVLSENKTFKIRTYPGCSVIELIFENAIYRLIGLEAVKVGSPKNETVHYLSTEEHNARQEEKQKARQEEKQQDRGSTKLSRFFSSLLQHDS
ncbi:hypothetical protein BD408DRAFT_411320 [Parasitella parasitica]|nr:hypothetical protein BD408DRAFT_411320 [Parasitella parasitica]